MEENIKNKLTDELIEEIANTEQKKIVIEVKEIVTPEQRMAIECIKKLKNPFVMLDVEYVMKDLKICKSIAYKIFQSEDFPSINVGKTYKVMLLPYLMWKCKKQK